MKKHKKLYIIVFICIIIVLFVFYYWHFTSSKKFNFEDINVIVYKDNYDMRISYPRFNNKEFNKKVEAVVDKEKKELISIVNESINNKEDSTLINYELIINYNCLIKEDIYSIHFKILRFVGGAHYERDDMIFYYDRKNNKELFIDDLVSNKVLFYNTLKEECKKYLLDNKEVLGTYYDNEMILEGLENIEFVTFGDDYVWVIFPPYSVGPWSSGEILVPIKYEVINRYLNPTFFWKIDYNDNNEIADEIDNSNKVQSIVRDDEFYKDKKLVALTFDDGPSWNKTEKLLDGLRERNAKVSFFMLGSRIKGQEKLVKRIYDEGHTIGSHSYEHKNFHNTDLLEALEDINKTNQMLKEITGVWPRYLRPPYGNYTKELLDETDMSFILWNVDSLDWKKKNSDKIAQYIIETAQDGDIVLLHDLYDTSIEGAFKAIDELSKEGFAFVSLDELIEIKGINAEYHKAYRYFK